MSAVRCDMSSTLVAEKEYEPLESLSLSSRSSASSVSEKGLIRYVYPLSLSAHPPESSSHETTARPNPRKRKLFHVNNISKNEKIIRLPKILTTDIRKKYPIMILNVMNGCNYRSIDDFIRLCCDGNCQFKWILTRSPNRTAKSFDEAKQHAEVNSTFCVKLETLTNIINYLFFLGMILPDRVFHMVQSNVITRSDSFETRIEVYYRIHGTRTYMCSPLQAGTMVRSHHASCINSIKSGLNSSDEEVLSGPIDGISHEFSLYKMFYQRIQRLKILEQVTAYGRITLLVENYRESMKIKDIIFEAFALE